MAQEKIPTAYIGDSRQCKSSEQLRDAATYTPDNPTHWSVGQRKGNLISAWLPWIFPYPMLGISQKANATCRENKSPGYFGGTESQPMCSGMHTNHQLALDYATDFRGYYSGRSGLAVVNLYEPHTTNASSSKFLDQYLSAWIK